MVMYEAPVAYSGSADALPASAPPTLRPGQLRHERIDILGILIDSITCRETLAQIDRFIQAGRPQQIVTINVDFLNIGYRDPAFVTLLNAAALAVPDGMPLLWVARLLGQPLLERITGTDLLYGAADLAARKGYRMFLLGAAPGVAATAGIILAQRFPGLQIVGTYAPPEQAAFDAAENAHIVAQIRAARPDLLFVALGTPKQEKWIAHHLDALGVPVCIGIGGVLNFLTGRVARAPAHWQRAGLEWLYRLLREPGRLWRRYLVDDSRVLVRALLTAARRRLGRPSGSNYDAEQV